MKLRSLINNKKGQLTQTGEGGAFSIFTFMITAFLIVVFFAGLIYAMGLINSVMHNAGLANEVNAGKESYTNMTLASDQIFGQVYQSIQALRMVAIVYILALAVAIMVTNAMVKIHPLFFFAYILLGVLAVVFSVPISNSYETLLGSGIYNGELVNFTASNWFLLNLPTMVLIISVLGGIFMFINLVRGGGEGNLQ